MKKIASLVGAGALLLTMATATFATNNWHHRNPRPMPRSEDELTIENSATVDNLVVTVANSGLNWTSDGGRTFSRSRHHFSKDAGDIRTGDADAVATLTNRVNWNNVAGCGCFDDVKIENKRTSVDNDVWTVANTGLNRTGRGDIRTGNAYADSLVDNVINTTIVGE